ncbi:MAG TPA: flagellar hook-length control protein FliK [Syntrophomonadaceae bacterium]|nr:flagellar hook-length control protein FliK [Syntrophomonadaceae bacterium]
MTVPNTVLLERPADSGMNKESRIKNESNANKATNKFAQCLSAAGKSQNSQPANEPVKNKEASPSDAGEKPVKTEDQHCKTEDRVSQTGPKPKVGNTNEKADPGEEPQANCTVNGVVLTEPVLSGEAQPETNSAKAAQSEADISKLPANISTTSDVAQKGLELEKANIKSQVKAPILNQPEGSKNEPAALQQPAGAPLSNQTAKGNLEQTVINASPSPSEGSVNEQPVSGQKVNMSPSGQTPKSAEPELVILKTPVSASVSEKASSSNGQSDQNNNLSDNAARISPEGNGSIVTKTMPLDESGLLPSLGAASNGCNTTDPPMSMQALAPTVPAEVVTEKANQVGITAAKRSFKNSSTTEQPETNNIQNDVKKIMVMENNRSAKIQIVKSSGQKMKQSDSKAENEPDVPKLNVFANQTDTGQVRETASKLINTPAKEPVDPRDLIQQIVKKAEVMLKSDISEMKMQLKPEFLGKMMIKVTVEDGAVVTKIITENQHVKQALEANLNSLRQNLEANGMKVEKTEVSVQLFNDGGGSFNGSDSNRYPLWPDQQGQNRRNASPDNYALTALDSVPESLEENIYYGTGSNGQVNYLI